MASAPGKAARVTLAVFGVALLVVIGFAIGKRAQPPPEPGPKQELKSTPAVLVAVRALARLESVSFHMERIIDLKERQPKLFGLVEATDEILLVAAGDVTAGVDLQKMRDGDVILEPELRRVRIVLPPVEIVSTRLDNDRTYVHTRKTDVLADRVETIETRARQLAEQSIHAAALEAGILARAKQSAEHTVRALVISLGYDEVVIDWAED